LLVPHALLYHLRFCSTITASGALLCLDGTLCLPALSILPGRWFHCLFMRFCGLLCWYAYHCRHAVLVLRRRQRCHYGTVAVARYWNAPGSLYGSGRYLLSPLFSVPPPGLTTTPPPFVMTFYRQFCCSSADAFVLHRSCHRSAALLLLDVILCGCSVNSTVPERYHITFRGFFAPQHFFRAVNFAFRLYITHAKLRTCCRATLLPVPAGVRWFRARGWTFAGHSAGCHGFAL